MNKHENTVRTVRYIGTNVQMEITQRNNDPVVYMIAGGDEHQEGCMFVSEDDAQELFDFLADALGAKTARNTQ